MLYYFFLLFIVCSWVYMNRVASTGKKSGNHGNTWKIHIFPNVQMCTPRCPVKIPGKLDKSPGNTWNIPGKWKSKFAGHPDESFDCY